MERKKSDGKTIKVPLQIHERLTRHTRKNQTYAERINEFIEELQFQKKAKPILEKAKRVMERHEKVGSNWAEVEESFRDLLALVDDFLEELKRR